MILYLPRDHKRKLFLAIPTINYSMGIAGFRVGVSRIRGARVVSEFAWDLSSFSDRISCDRTLHIRFLQLRNADGQAVSSK